MRFLKVTEQRITLVLLEVYRNIVTDLRRQLKEQRVPMPKSLQ